MFRQIFTKTPTTSSLLFEIGKTLASSIDIEDVYQQFTEIVNRKLPFEQMVITDIDAKRNVRISHFSGLKIEDANYGAPIALKGTLTDQVLQSRSPYLYQGRSRDQITEEHPWLLPTVDVGINSWLAVPLISQDEVIGAIAVTSKVINAFTKEDTDLLNRVAGQIALPIANSRLYAESVKRNQESQALYRISRALAKGGSFQQKVSRVAEELAGIAETESVGLRIPNPTDETLDLVASSGFRELDINPPANIPYGAGVIGSAFETGETVLENDYCSYPDAVPFYLDAGVKSVLAMPVKFDEQIIGVIVYSSLKKGHFTEPRVMLLATVANVLGPLFQTAISAADLAVSDEVARIMTSTLNIEEVYAQFAAAIKTLVDFDRVNINIIDHDVNVFRLAYLDTEAPSSFTVGETFALEGTATGFVCDSRSTLIMNFSEHPEFRTSQRNLAEGSRSTIVLPLFCNDRVIGILAVFSKKMNAFGPKEQAVLERLATLIAPAIENARLYEEIRQAEETKRLRNLELESLYGIARILAQPGNFGDRARLILEELAELAQADWVTLREWDESGEAMPLVAAAGFNPAAPLPVLRTQREQLAHQALVHGKPIVINDYPAHPLASEAILALGMKSMILYPLRAQGRTLGLLDVISKDVDHFTPQRVRLLTTIGEGLGVFLENAGLRQQLEATELEMATVDEVARIVSSTLDIDEAYRQICNQVQNLVEFDQVGIVIFSEDLSQVTIAYQSEKTSSILRQGESYPMEGTFSARLLETRNTVVFDNLEERRDIWSSEHRLKEGLHSIILAPLISGETIYGALFLFSRQTDGFGGRERVIVERLAAQIAPAVEHAALFQKTQRLALALESIGDAVAFLSVSGAIEYVNRAFEELYAYKAAELVGQPITVMALDDSESRSLASDIQQQAIRDGWKGEVRAMTKLGDELDVLLTATPVRDNDGKVMGRISVSRDITERKLVEERMRETARLASIGELASGVAHEINNPLASILGFAQLLTLEAPESIKNDIEKIYSEAQRAAKIVQSLLLFARKTEPKRELTDINLVLERALELKSADFYSSGIRISRDLSIEPLSSMVDDHQLTQVFVNILTNAQQSIESSGKNGHISIRSSSSDGVIEVRITDNGPGIDPKVMERIFEPFFTTKPVGVGTGLGLSICYGIIKDHGGDLWFEDSEDDGPAFHLTIPIVLSEDGEASSSPESLGCSTTRHILIVDDEPTIREILQTSLEFERYTVDLAADSQEAWRKLSAMTYDCVVIDLKMPGFEGKELYQRIEEVHTDLTNKVIFITGDTSDPESSEFLSNKSNPVLIKPFEAETFRRQLTDLMDGK